MREEMIEKKYEEMGISKEVYLFGKKIEDELKERFAAIDATAEYGDELITLTTCSYYTEDGRFVVVGKKRIEDI